MVDIQGFETVKILGSGSTATVQLSRSKEHQGELLAVKVFHQGLLSSPEFRMRILAEVRALSKLNHPNIVPVISSSASDNEIPWIAFEYVDGQPLSKFQAQLPYILPEVSLFIAIEILKALEHAHENKIIHRDLKPSNILISRNGEVKVTDFGLAKITDATSATNTGSVLGSPDYMSPEQARGDFLGEESDLFSVSSILYFLITGTRPFNRSSILSTLSAVGKAECESITKRNPKVSPLLAKIIHKGLSQSIHDRYRTAKEYRECLENYLNNLGVIYRPEMLKEFISNPSDFSMEMLKRFAESLHQVCSNEIKQKHHDRAMDLVQHLSIVAPESEAVIKIMEQIHERQNGRSGKKIYLTIALILLITISSSFFIISKNEVKRSDGAVANQTQIAKSKIIQPVVINEPVTPKVELPVVEAKQPEVSGVSKSEKKKTPVAKKQIIKPIKFEVGEGIDIEWDGKVVDLNEPFNAKVGKHSLRLIREGYAPIEQQIEVMENEPTVIRVK